MYAYREQDAVASQNLALDAPGEVLHFVRGHGVLHPYAHRAELAPRAVVVDDHVVDPEHLVVGGYLLLEGLDQPAVHPLAEQAVERRHHHLHARADDDRGDANSQCAVQPGQHVAEDDVHQRGGQRGSGNDRVEERVARGDLERVGLVGFALPAVVAAQEQLCADRQHEHGDSGPAVLRRLRVQSLVEGLHERKYSGAEDDQGYGQGREVFEAAEAEGMFAVRGFVGQADSGEHQHRRQRVGEVVQRIQNYGYRIGNQAYCGLGAAEGHVRPYPHRTGADDVPLPYVGSFPGHLRMQFKNVNIANKMFF